IFMLSFAHMNAQEQNQQEIKMFQPIETLTTQLGLSADQAAKLQAIDNEYASKYVNAAITDREKVLNERHQAYRKVLTTAQYNQYAVDNNLNTVDLKEDAQQVGSDIKRTSENVKDQAVQSGRGVQERVKDAGEDIGSSVKKDAQNVRRDVRQETSTMKRDANEKGNDIKKDAKEAKKDTEKK
ncbi:MAG: hypothetical protein LIO93_07630, partial [Bacteroidales bacterium]|nr:hypothetical protein [Bacteroidales bacterium]